MAAQLPRILIPVPTAADTAYNQRAWPEYARAVAQGGGEPVQASLDLSRRELRTLLQRCAGVCLPGSPADVDPARYGVDRHPETAPADPAREELDFFLLDLALNEGKPVLGICYGLQSMNVWRGGSLVQDLSPVPVNHAAGRSVAVAHTAQVSENSALAVLLSQPGLPGSGNSSLDVNSSHHQAVASPGDGLRIVARSSEDGVIEALEHDPADPELSRGWFLGVQWHPERSTELSASSHAIFRALVQQASRSMAAVASR